MQYCLRQAIPLINNSDCEKIFSDIEMSLRLIQLKFMASKSSTSQSEKISNFNIIKTLQILKTSIISPRSLLVSRVVKPNFFNLSVYVKPRSLIISLVARFCTFSNKPMSFLRYGLQAYTQYSSFGRTCVWVSDSIRVRVCFIFLAFVLAYYCFLAF